MRTYAKLRQNGISLPPEEPVIEDQWQKSYKLRKMIERGEMPLSRASVDVALLKGSRALEGMWPLRLYSRLQGFRGSL